MALAPNLSPMQAAIARAGETLKTKTSSGMARIAEDLGFDTHPANFPDLAFRPLGWACFEAMAEGGPQSGAAIRDAMDGMALACRQQSELHAETLALASCGGCPASGLDLLFEASGVHFSQGFFSRFSSRAPHRGEIIDLAGKPIRRSLAWDEIPCRISRDREVFSSFLSAEEQAAARYAGILNAIAPADASFRSGILVGFFLGHPTDPIRRYPAAYSPNQGFSQSRIADMFFSMNLAIALVADFGFGVGPLASTGLLGKDVVEAVIGRGSFAARDFVLSAANGKADGLAALAEAQELASSVSKPEKVNSRKTQASL